MKTKDAKKKLKGLAPSDLSLVRGGQSAEAVLDIVVPLPTQSTMAVVN
jgi:hypothetical protein